MGDGSSPTRFKEAVVLIRQPFVTNKELIQTSIQQRYGEMAMANEMPPERVWCWWRKGGHAEWWDFRPQSQEDDRLHPTRYVIESMHDAVCRERDELREHVVAFLNMCSNQWAVMPLEGRYLAKDIANALGAAALYIGDHNV